jgi:hypothetical protein
MRWKNKTGKRTLFLDSIFAKETVYNAYREGYINYNVYMAAIEKTRTNFNGDWMFENGSKHLY